MKNFTLGLFSYRSKTVMVKHKAEAMYGFIDDAMSTSGGSTIPKDTPPSQGGLNVAKETTQAKMSELDQAKTILAKIKGKIFDGSSFTELRKLLEKVATDNKAAQADIFKEMDALINEKTSVLQGYTSGNKNELMQLRGDFDASYKAVETQKNNAVAEVKKGTKKLISKEVEVNNNLDLLSNLNGDKSIDNTNRDFVNERNLKKAISWASNRPGGLEAVYTEVTGKSPADFSPKGIEEFHSSLRVSMSVIKQLTKGNAGLDAFLQGQTGAFIAEVAKRVKANNNKPLEVRIEDSTKLSPTMHNLLGVAGTVGVAVLTQGVVTFGHQKDAITAEQFIAKEGEEKEGGFFNTLGKAASWVKDAFLGRKLSLTLGRERVADYKKSVTNFVTQVMNLNPTTKVESITDPILRSAFETALRTAKKANIDLSKPEEFEKIQKALIQSYIIGEGFKNEGSNWSASIGLLMLVGAHRDAIGMEALRTEESEYNNAERAVTKMTISKYEGAGISIEKPKTRGGNWIYTIPTELQLPGDDDKMPVKSNITTLSADGKSYIHTTTQSQHVELSFRNDEYVLTFSDAMGKMPEVHPETMPVTKLLRDRVTDLKKKPVADLLYSVGHMREFDGLILKLASQDFEGAKAWLENMSKKGKYKSLAKKLLNEVSTKVGMSTWTSYMYGSSKSRAHQEYTQTFANKEVRTSATISAEDRLAKKLGLPTTNESHFQIGPKEKFVPKQATEIFGERSMTIASFATPKGAAHRLDTYDGSVTMSQKVRVMEDATEKKAVIEAIWKNTAKNKGMEAELKKLNAFIDTNNATQWLPVSTPVSIEQYKAYLVSWDMKDLWEIPGLSMKAGFEPKVFEGRAMIAGNVCLNRLYGIIYPSFMLGGIPQQVPPVITADRSTPLNGVNVATTTTDIGVNPIALFNKPKPTEHPSVVTTPGEGQVGSVYVDWRVVGEVTAPGRITIGTTQFRLAPGQTMSQFLGEKFASSTYMAAGELTTTQKILNYLGQFIVATVEGVEGYNEIDINKPQTSEKTE